MSVILTSPSVSISIQTYEQTCLFFPDGGRHLYCLCSDNCEGDVATGEALSAHATQMTTQTPLDRVHWVHSLSVLLGLAAPILQ